MKNSSIIITDRLEHGRQMPSHGRRGRPGEHPDTMALHAAIRAGRMSGAACGSQRAYRPFQACSSSTNLKGARSGRS